MMMTVAVLVCSASALVPSLGGTAASAGIAAFGALGPQLFPTIKSGKASLDAKYNGTEQNNYFSFDGWRGVFPEYDGTWGALSTTHTTAPIAVAFFLFFGALMQAQAIADDPTAGSMGDVYALALYGFAFQGDTLTHWVLSSGADGQGNIMQKGHMIDTLPMIVFFLYANYLDGGAWYALTDLPSDGWWMLVPRIVTSPLFLLLTFYLWQPLHGLGVWVEQENDDK